ncbi:MAG: sugar transferase [Planctomycetota bacterium]
MSTAVVDPPEADFTSVTRLLPEDLASHRSKMAFRSPIQERKLALLMLDLVAILCSAIAAFAGWYVLRGEEAVGGVISQLGEKWYWVPLSMTVWLAALWLVDLYDVTISGIGGVLLPRLGLAATLTVAVFLFGYFFAPQYTPRTYFLIFTAVAALLTGGIRSRFHEWAERSGPIHHVLFIGDRESASELQCVFTLPHRLKFSLLAWTDESMLSKLHFDHGPQGLCRYSLAEGISEIVVRSRQGIEDDEVYRALVECTANGIRVSSMAEVFGKLSRQVPMEFVDSKWVLGAMQDRALFSRVQLGVKRLIDIAGALVAMPILGVITIPVMIAIKLDSVGPIFYLQERTGRAGRKFWIIKFRTMTDDAEKDGKAVWAKKDDARITKVGSFLRKTRLDEFPQFVNVLRGEMSLVGPRPEREEIEADLDRQLPHYFIRRLVKPGITGWAQVHYKYGNCLADSLMKLQYDAYYVRHWTILMDLYVMVRTIFIMASRRGQ